MRLFVASLPADFDDVDVKEMFELYGSVKEVKLIFDRASGKSKGFGFVEMPNDIEAHETIATLNGTSLRRGKKLVVQKAEEDSRNFNKSQKRKDFYG